MLIVSRDTVFAEALQIALRTAGMKTDILSALPAYAGDDMEWILDLDSISPSTVLPARAVTFSRASLPHADFVRPFLFRDLIELVQNRFLQASPVDVSAPGFAPVLQRTAEGVLLQGKPLSLSPAEYALLSLLMETPGQCVSIERINSLWQEKGGNTTAVYIRYLRKKIDEPTGLRLIRTVRGRGYCLCLPE